MSKILVFGHQNPDTDAIGSSYAFAELSRLRGLDTAEVVALGDVNEETAFALNYFGVPAPRVVTSAKAEGADQVILKPVGSASSIVYRQFKADGREIPKATAGLLLSGLISDTLLLKSPTTHETDVKVAEDLAKIAGVDLETYGLALLKAGTNLATKPADVLIDIDAKTFELNGHSVRVAQVNTVDIPEVLARQSEIEAAMTTSIQANADSDFVLMVTDIVNSNSEILALGKNSDKVEAAFNFELKDNHAFLAGAVSRKKQVVPQLTESFSK